MEGTAYGDLNGNGVLDAGEPGLAGAVLALRKDGVEIATTTSRSGGFYGFTALQPASYQLLEKAPPTGYQLNPSIIGFALAAGQTVMIDFGHAPVTPSVHRRGYLPLMLWLPPVLATPTPTTTPTLTATPTATSTPRPCQAYEPNDTPGAAAGPLINGQSIRAGLCDGDSVDYYYFDVPDAVRVQLNLDELPANTDFDLFLYRLSGGAAIAESRNREAAPEHISINLEPGRYLIQIWPSDIRRSDQPYRLVVSW